MSAKKASKKIARKTTKRATRKSPAPKEPATLLETVGPGWELERESTSLRGTRGGAADPLPAYLRGPEWQELDRVVVKPASERRSTPAGGSSMVTLSAALDPEEAVLAVARQASGAISFHRPATGWRGAAAALTFEIPVLDGDAETGSRGIISKALRVVLIKAAKKLVGTVVEHAAEWAVPRLACALEERLWKDRPKGWLRVNPATLAGNSLVAGKPDFPRGERGLLLVHGIFSSTHGAFGDLASGSFFDEARKIYGSNIFAFDHMSFSKTPAENVRELLDSLDDKDLAFDVVCHSRGGLLIRELMEGSGLDHPKRERLKIGNVVLVACPCIGSPLTSPDYWDKRLSWLANLLDMFPENPFTTGAAWLTEALGWFAENIMGHTPGMVAMDPSGDFIRHLQEPPDAPTGTDYHALTANFHPPRQLLARFADMGIDHFFAGANDLAVWTEGVWKTGGVPDAWIPASRIGCFGPGGNLVPEDPGAANHLTFFKHPRTTEFILAALGGKPLGLPEIDPLTALPSRNVISRRSAIPATTERTAPQAMARRTAATETGARGSVGPGSSGWDREDELSITVVSNGDYVRVADQKRSRDVPMLIARYGSARVVVPFYTGGANNNAGSRWQKIIKAHNLIVDYANGKEVTFRSQDGESTMPTRRFLEEFGEVLFDTLIPDEVRNLYNVARFRHNRRALRITFTSTIPWVADIPWEFAYDKSCSNFLCCGDARFVRNVVTPTPATRFDEECRPLRLLVVSAQPSDMGRLSAEEERLGIMESFRPLTQAGLLEVEVLTGATVAMLHEILRSRPPGMEFDILHFIGHGEFDEATKTGYLHFQDPFGRSRRVSAECFLNVVQGRSIRVIFLNACETGRGKKADYNRGAAMTLVRDGIPAVLANQYSVLDRSASEFSLHFYSCLAQGLSLGEAMREARIALLYSGVELIDWGVPVLFASNPEARLCSPTVAGTKPPVILSAATPRAARRSPGPRRTTVAIWDAENSLVHRENLEKTLAELNAAQDSFAFQLESFSAPRNLWQVDKNASSDGVAYLRESKVMERMELIRSNMGADFLFCLTTLPVRDEQTTSLYYCQRGRIVIFSVWQLDPPLEGERFKKAFANHLAIPLLEELSGVGIGCESNDDPLHPIHTVGYFNDEKSVEHLAGPMTLTRGTLKELKKAISANRITTTQFAAIQTLFSLYSR